MTDHHYDSAMKEVFLNFIKQMIDNSENLDDSNFCPNVLKKKNIELETDEKNYKRDHSAFRSKIESNYFGILV